LQSQGRAGLRSAAGVCRGNRVVRPTERPVPGYQRDARSSVSPRHTRARRWVRCSGQFPNRTLARLSRNGVCLAILELRLGSPAPPHEREAHRAGGKAPAQARRTRGRISEPRPATRWDAGGWPRRRFVPRSGGQPGRQQFAVEEGPRQTERKGPPPSGPFRSVRPWNKWSRAGTQSQRNLPLKKR